MFLSVTPLMLTSIVFAKKGSDQGETKTVYDFDNGEDHPAISPTHQLKGIEILIETPYYQENMNYLYFAMLVICHLILLPAAEAIYFFLFLYKFWQGFTGKIIV